MRCCDGAGVGVGAVSIRARRLAKYLEDHLGWIVYEVHKACPNGHTTWRDDSFCGVCGKRLVNDKEAHKAIARDIEGAIAYALGEIPWPRSEQQ